MARVVAVVNQKGGAGKTTLAMQLAGALARRAPTVVVDLDPQASAVQWASAGGLPFPATVKALPVESDRAGLLARFRGHHYLVLDCPPALGPPARAALRAADLALVPVLPSPVDLWSSLTLPQEIAAARRDNPRLRAHLVVNQLEPGSALSAAMHGALAEFGLPVLAAGLRRRAVYRTAALEGVAVHQLGARGRAAAAEIDAILEELRL